MSDTFILSNNFLKKDTLRLFTKYRRLINIYKGNPNIFEGSQPNYFYNTIKNFNPENNYLNEIIFFNNYVINDYSINTIILPRLIRRKKFLTLLKI